MVLHAAGDPSWTPTFTGGRPGRSMLRALAKKKAHDSGNRRIEGDVMLDTSVFTEPRSSPRMALGRAPSTATLRAHRRSRSHESGRRFDQAR